MSSFDEIRNVFQSCTSTDEMIAIFDAIGALAVSKNDYKAAKDNLIGLLQSDDGHNAAALVLSLAKSKGESSLRDLRKVGAFRLSRYKYGRATVLAVSTLAHVADKAGFSANAIQYLASLKALHSLRADLLRMEQFVIAQLSERRKVVLKTLLVIVDRAFLKGWSGGDKSLPGNEVMHHGIEDLAEALSTLVLIYKREFGLEPLDWEYLDQDGAIEKDEYLELLKVACVINNFKRAETLVDGLPYNAKLLNEKVVIYSADPRLEKSVRLGYIQQSMQAEIRIQKILELHEKSGGTPTFDDAVSSLFDKVLKYCIIVAEHPIKRLRFAVPFDVGLIEALNQPYPYFEEILLLLQMDVDDFSEGQLWASEIKGEVKVSDVLKVQRFFSLLNQVYASALNVFDGEEAERLEIESVVTFMPRNAFINVLGYVVDDKVAEQIINMLTLSAEVEHIDLQYRPFIQAGDHIVCSPSLVAYSNLVRNISVGNGLYTGWPRGEDPMVLRLRDALDAAGFKVEIEVDFPFGKDLDADVLALKDGILFIFECKHAYHPCNVHELRNIHYHVLKGESQLDIRVPLLNQPALLKKLLDKLDWSGEEVSQIRGAIVTATRVFHGSYSGDWLVVQVKELINIITTGQVRGPEGVYRVWKGEEFHVSDLEAYLDGETLIGDQLATMIPFNESHPMGSRELVFDTWHMDPFKHFEILSRKYPYFSDPAD
ncbi:hypothetical protein [Pseudomonas thivervalensis]|uniref:hypothetical protein n=1 Tax=Pseudomonas thivervalensis TaxID=86265 RepID=UPI00069CFEAF|nr:hypothetical protein [Pseudomonas thivervalensis]